MGSINYTIYPENNLVHMYGKGNIEYHDLIDTIKELHSNSSWNDKFNTFVDFENAVVEYFLEGFVEFKFFFEKMQDHTHHRKWAIYTKRVVDNSNGNLAVLMHSKTITVKMFQNRDMALNFLGVPTKVKKELAPQL